MASSRTSEDTAHKFPCPKCGADALHYITEMEGLDADGNKVIFNLRKSPIPKYRCSACGEITSTTMFCGHDVCENGRYGRCIAHEMSH